MTNLKTAIIELTDMTCGHCSGAYAISESFRQYKQEKGGFWHCPYCDVSWGYHESELEKTVKLLAEEKRRHQDTLARLNETAASLGKTRKRVSGGACPCCNRTFQQLGRHMKTKHPEYGKP